MSTGESQPWTSAELSDRAANIQMMTWQYSQQLIQYCDGNVPSGGPVIITPEAMKEFYESIKRLWAAMLRELADQLEGRPLPPPPGANE